MKDFDQPLFSLDQVATPTLLEPAHAPSRRDRSIFEQVEIEAKFVHAPGATMPDLAGVAPVKGRVAHILNAVYFDTPDLRLMAAGITLRRRSGGDDSGWHLKVKGTQEGAKTEVHTPISGARPPAALRALLPQDLRAAPLLPVLKMGTKRLETTLATQTGRPVATVCEDDVTVVLAPRGQDLPPLVPASSWKEVEIELVGSDRRALAHLSRLLGESGFARADYSSKAGRALSDWVVPLHAHPARKRVHEYAHRQVGLLQSLEEDVLLDEDAAVHQARVAARRLRSTLTSFSDFFSPSLACHVMDELRWYGALLSESRDVTIVQEYLAESLSEPSWSRSHEVLTRILGQQRRGAAARMREELLSPRFELLQDSLAELISPYTPTESKTIGPKADDEIVLWLSVVDAVSAAQRRLRKAISTTHSGIPLAISERSVDAEVPLQWHSLRKAAKRARYAFEVASPNGEAAQAWESATSALGALQDYLVVNAAISSASSRPVIRRSPENRAFIANLRENLCQSISGALDEGCLATERALAASVRQNDPQRSGDRSSFRSSTNLENHDET